MDKPLPRIGVDKLYAALVTSDDSSGVVYGTPFALQGVTEIGYNPNTQMAVFYADDGAYESISQDGETDLNIKVADLLPAHYALLMGVTQSANGVIDEDRDDNPPEVAIGYRTKKSNGEYRYVWVLKGKFGKPQISAQTGAGSINMQQMEIPYKGLNRDYDGKKRRKVDTDDDLFPTGLTNAAMANEVTGWFSSPDYVPVAPGTPIADLAAATGSGAAGTMALTFSAPTGATSVKVQAQDAAFGTWVDVETSATITDASTGATVEGLTAGNTYSVRLVVVGGTKNGISNTASAVAHA